jgi:uncharacterized membrane protein YoaT (DUF817 family)
MLNSGMQVAEIEACLRANGLPPERIQAVMEQAIADRFHTQSVNLEFSARWTRLNRIVSAIFCLAYVAISYSRGNAEFAVRCAVDILFPLVCIWFADEMGAYVGPIGIGETIVYRTPGTMVRIGGWILLLAIGGFKIVRW